jgi:hypothetical protein
MAKDLKKRVKRLEEQVEDLTRKVQALGRTAPKETSKRAKVAVAPAVAPTTSKVKPAVVKPALVERPELKSPSGSASQSG